VKLPRASEAIIPAEKLRDYLLSLESEESRSKAIFFARLGYTRGEWAALERDLRSQILPLDAEEAAPSRFGRKFIIPGSLTGPSGATSGVTTIWIIRFGEEEPRLVTAYPGRTS
jgi:hypothetical protein